MVKIKLSQFEGCWVETRTRLYRVIFHCCGIWEPAEGINELNGGYFDTKAQWPFKHQDCT